MGEQANTVEASDTKDQYRHAIVQRAVGRRSELVEVIVGNILDELSEYANGRSPAELEDIRVGVQHSIDLCLSIIHVGGRPLDHDEHTLLRGTGAQRARQGIPKPAVLASVKIAMRVGRTFLMTCTDVGDDAAALMAAFRRITEALDTFEDEACSALGDGHDEGSAEVLMGGDRGEAMLVDRLLEQRFVSDEEVLDHASRVGLSRHRASYVVTVSSVGVADEARLRATAADLRSVVVVAVGPLRLTSPLHLPLVVQPRDPAEWLQLVDRLGHIARRHGTAVVWSEDGLPLTALSPVYKTVREGLPFLVAATRWAGAVPSLLVRFHRTQATGTPAQRAALLAEILQPLGSLPDRERAELLEALDALYETGGSSAGLARHLHLHKNTVANRLRRVQEVLGLDVRRPAERLVVETALRMRHLANG